MPTKKKAPSPKTTKKAAAKKPLHRDLRVRLAKSDENFWTFQPSIQSVYWLVIAIAVVGVAVINFNTNIRVNDLLDQIDAQNQASLNDAPATVKH